MQLRGTSNVPPSGLVLHGGGKPEVTSVGPIPDGRGVTIPLHSDRTIGPLYHKILRQLGVSEQEFQQLR